MEMEGDQGGSERDVGVGGETSALNFREDMLTSKQRELEGGITNVRFPRSTEPLVFLCQPRLRVRKVRGNSPETLARQDRREDGMDGRAKCVRARTHTHIVRKPSNDCCGEHSFGTRAYSSSPTAWFPPEADK